jgi:hypothetical protein
MKSKSFLLLFFKKEDLSSLENIRAAGAKKINHDDTKNTKIVTKRAQPIFFLGEKRRGLRAFYIFSFLQRRRMFFFEKKNQKTFTRWFLVSHPGMRFGAGLYHYVAYGVGAGAVAGVVDRSGNRARAPHRYFGGAGRVAYFRQQ